MEYIRVNRLDGVPDSVAGILKEIDKKVKREEILIIVLYFMSELDDGGMTHKNIERNMRKVHEGEYSDYAASNIRGYFDKETKRVREGKQKEEQRLFVNIAPGSWKNSALANHTAKCLLEKLGYDIITESDLPDEADMEEIASVEAETENLEGKERAALINARVNQDKFRKRLLKGQKVCRICGMDQQELLIASHIKAWSDSTANEKLDPYNGLLLCPNHDAVFDKHLISFEEDGSIIISGGLNENVRKLMNISPDTRIKMHDKNKVYMKYHRELMKAKESLKK